MDEKRRNIFARLMDEAGLPPEEALQMVQGASESALEALIANKTFLFTLKVSLYFLSNFCACKLLIKKAAIKNTIHLYVLSFILC